jgi:flagellar hook protein FlgE
MSLFGAMNTAISGLTAQSNAFGNISDNVANSQTVGYKRVDTNFIDYLTTSTAAENDSGAVVARPDYVNNVQGTITQTDNPLGLAITGQGFFAVSQQTGLANTTPTFNPQMYYTRAGDFQMDQNGYLVNSAGQFLNGWPVNQVTGVVNQNTLSPIQVAQTVYNPVATTSVTISANLPATPASGTGAPAVMFQATDPDVIISVTNAAAITASTAAIAAEVAAGDPAGDGGAASGAAASAAVNAAVNLAEANAAAAAAGGTAAQIAAAVHAAGAAEAANQTTLAATAAATNGTGITQPTLIAGTVRTPSVPISSDIDVYDALGTLHTITLNWVQNAPNNWSVMIDSPDDQSGTTDLGTANATFGTNNVPAGTIGDVTVNAGDPGTITTTPYVPGGGTAATMTFTSNFGSGNQLITVNLGNYGQTNGVTQYAGTQYSLNGLTQNGVPPGAFASVTTQTNGNIVVNYNNGQSRTIAQVPLVTFNAPDKLQRQDGQSFTATLTSGTPLAEAAGSNGAGNLVTQSVESSNVDIATEFSQLIVAQQAYSANTKVVTTADQMLQQTINMQQ